MTDCDDVGFAGEADIATIGGVFSVAQTPLLQACVEGHCSQKPAALQNCELPLHARGVQWVIKFLTVTSTLAIWTFPALSRALAEIVCCPSTYPSVFMVTE